MCARVAVCATVFQTVGRLNYVVAQANSFRVEIYFEENWSVHVCVCVCMVCVCVCVLCVCVCCVSV